MSFPVHRDRAIFSVQWNKNPYFNLGLTIGYFWITLLVMFTLYFFIYQVASALEKRSQANAQKVSNLIGVPSSAMTNIVINMSVKHNVPETAVVPTSNKMNSKKKKSPVGTSATSSAAQRLPSIDDEDGNSSVNQKKRHSNGLDPTNRSSSNETSGENTPVGGIIAPNITNILALTKARIDPSKHLDEDRSLLPQSPTNSSGVPIFSHSSNRNNSNKKSTRSGNSNKARKALRTITVIMGAFVLCWTPVGQG